MAITIAMRTQVSQLYVSLFGRAPDAEGMGFWASAMADGMSMARVAQEMYNTAPARDYYPTAATNREIISIFYLNVLGREADAGGLDFWTREMDLAATKGDVFAKLLNNVVNYNGSDADGLKSQSLFLNKVAVAQYYGENGGDIVGAADVLVGVTDKYATVIEAKAAIDAGGVIGVQTYDILNQVQVTEGGVVTFNIATTGVAPGTEIAYAVSGTGSLSAIASTTFGVVTINEAGTASININVLDDKEVGEGLLSFKLIQGAKELAAAEYVLVKDNEVTQTYTVTSSSPTVIEGNSVTYNISTTGVAAGTELSYTVTGTNNTNASGSAGSGSVVINAQGKGSVTIETTANETVGDQGTLSFALKNGGLELATAPAVTVIDNDDTAEYAITVSDRNITEGDHVTFTIQTENVKAGTDLLWKVVGTNNVDNDNGFVTVNSDGVATVRIQTEDNNTFGDDGTLTFKLVNNGVTYETAAVVDVKDDEEAPANATVSVEVSEPFGSGDITEGDIIKFTVKTQGYEKGDQLAWSLKGTKNASGADAGLVTLDENGVGVVYWLTEQNTNPNDQGIITFNVAGTTPTTVTLKNEDVENFDNTYVLSETANWLGDTHANRTDKGNDRFEATIGSLMSAQSLTVGDKLNGGLDYDTLYIDVDGDEARFPVLTNSDTASFIGIEHVIIDLSDENDLEEDFNDLVSDVSKAGPNNDGDGIFFDEGEDGYIDISYFDTDFIRNGNKTLERFTVLANKDAETSESEDLFIHRDGIVLEFIGAGVDNNSVHLDEDIFVGKDVTLLTVELDGVGGDGAFNGENDGASDLEFHGGEDAGNLLEEIVINGTLAGETDSDLHYDWNVYDVSGSDYEYLVGKIELDAVLDLEIDTEDSDDIFYELETLTISISGEDQTVGFDLEDDLVKYASKIDFSGSSVNVVTEVDGDDLAKLNDDSSVLIEMGSGNDVLRYIIGFESDSDFEKPEGGSIVIDISTGGDDTIIISNDSGDMGNIFRTDSQGSSSDLIEDLIVINGFNKGDMIALDLEGYYSDDESPDLNFNLGNPTDTDLPSESRLDIEQVFESDFFDGISNLNLFKAVNAVAREMDEENNTEVVAIFEFDGSTYIYSDTNQIYGEDIQIPQNNYDNVGLSSGDVLIKLTGVTLSELGGDVSKYLDFEIYSGSSIS